MIRRLTGMVLLALPVAMMLGCGNSTPTSSANSGPSQGPKGNKEEPKKLAPVDTLKAPPGK